VHEDPRLPVRPQGGLTVGLFSTTGFTDDLAAEAAASRGKILLTLDELYDQSS
jgi:hypothetical protein